MPHLSKEKQAAMKTNANTKKQKPGDCRRFHNFDEYHLIRSTQVFFSCPHCSFKEEMCNWLFVKTTEAWHLHLGKFHKCKNSGGKTIKCSQKYLPDHARDWRTISNDTAKKFLKAGLLVKYRIAKLPSHIESLDGKASFDTSSNIAEEKSKDRSHAAPVLSSEHDTVSSQINKDCDHKPPTLLTAPSCKITDDFAFDALLDQLDFSPFEQLHSWSCIIDWPALKAGSGSKRKRDDVHSCKTE